jgi:hypothetical protein
MKRRSNFMRMIVTLLFSLSIINAVYASEVLELIIDYENQEFTIRSYNVLNGEVDVPVRGEYKLTLFNSKGNEIYSTNFDIPLYIDVPPDPITGESYQIRLSKGAKVLRVPFFQDIKAMQIGPQYFDFRFIPFASPVPAPNTEVIYGNCLGSSCFDLLFVSDGYSDMNQFKTDAAVIANFFGTIEPYRSNPDRIRIIRVDNTTPLGCYNNCSGIQRLICCDSSKVFSAVSGLDYDEILVITNMNEYGGSGYIDGTSCADRSTYAVTFRDTSYYAKEVAVHETGHSFGGLWDEYEYGSNGSGDGPNCVHDSTCAKWKGVSGTGCYAGCSYNGMYRPTENSCLMRTLTPDGGYKFCPVCKNEIDSKLKRCFSSSCIPNCANKECGDDGCGGSCGGCNNVPADYCLNSTTLRDYNGTSSCQNYKCVYPYTDKTCPYGCLNGKCQSCTPDCTNKECGDDGCGGSCGNCNNIPADYCLDMQTLRDYSPYGNCNNYKCVYPYTDKKCDYLCDQNRCVSKPVDAGTDVSIYDTETTKDIQTQKDTDTPRDTKYDVDYTDIEVRYDVYKDTIGTSSDEVTSGCSCNVIY